MGRGMIKWEEIISTALLVAALIGTLWFGGEIAHRDQAAQAAITPVLVNNLTSIQNPTKPPKD